VRAHIYGKVITCALEREGGDAILSRVDRIRRELREDWLPLSIIVVVFFAILLFVPIFPETIVHVQTSGGFISSVWVDSSAKSLISRFFSPSYPQGEYTLIGNVTLNGVLITRFSFNNVSSIGDYEFLWQSFGMPPLSKSMGSYEIEVQLYKLGVSQNWLEYFWPLFP